MVVSPMWRGHPWLRSGWKILPTRIGYCSNTNGDYHFQFVGNNVAFTCMQPHNYREVGSCHQLGWSSQELILSILALGAMPKQQQQRHVRDTIPALLKPQLCWKKTDSEWGRAMKGNVRVAGFLLFVTVFVPFAKHWAFCEHEEPCQATPIW